MRRILKMHFVKALWACSTSCLVKCQFTASQFVLPVRRSVVIISKGQGGKGIRMHAGALAW